MTFIPKILSKHGKYITLFIKHLLLENLVLQTHQSSECIIYLLFHCSFHLLTTPVNVCVLQHIFTTVFVSSLLKLHAVSLSHCLSIALLLLSFLSGSLVMDHGPLGTSLSPGSHSVLLSPHICTSVKLHVTYHSDVFFVLLVILCGLSSSRPPQWRGGHVARAPLGDASASLSPPRSTKTLHVFYIISLYHIFCQLN